MIRRPRLAALALAGLGAFACGRNSGPPPVVFVSIDTLRADRLPDWGYANGRTPNLSGLTARGVRFSNAWAQVPMTLPSHVSLLTGLLPPDAGVRSNIGYRFDAAATRSLPTALAEKGYATAGFVSAYVLRQETGLAGAFQRYDDAMEVRERATLGALQRPGVETVAAAKRWLDTVPRGRPYFLFVHLFEPHFPYEPPPGFRDLADPYDGEIAAADAALGSLLDALEARGDLERALVAVFSDHGEGLGDHGEQEHGVLLYREALHVPIVLALPGRRRAGEVVDVPSALVDLFPTVAEAVGIAGPERPAGRSLLGLSGADAGRRVYSETLYPRLHLGWSELRALADSRWHYIDGPDPELYDLRADPRERNNLRDGERRVAAERRAELAEVPLAFEAPAPASAEEIARLAALGYLGTTSAAAGSEGPLPDPKAHLGVLADVQRSFTLSSEGRWTEALDLCRRLLADNPDLVDVRNQMAAILRKLGRFAEALEVDDETGRRWPHLAASLAIERAKLLLDLGRLDEAEAAARSALEANPLEARLVLSASAGRRGDWDRAVEQARAGLGDPRHPRLPALLLLAQALAESGRLESALTEIERAAERQSQPGVEPVPSVDSTRGDILARLGRSREAEAAFRREIERFPRTLAAYVRLSVLLAAEHRFDEIRPTLDAMVTAVPRPRAYEEAAATMERLGNAEAAADYRRRARTLAASDAGARLSSE